jgi:hypothetical protein
MGTEFSSDDFDPPIMINDIFLDGSMLYLPQFISLFNPSDNPVDLSGYAITKGVTAVIPEGTVLGPRKRLFMTENKDDYIWNNFGPLLLEWQSGKLSENGESIELVNSNGFIIDHIEFSIGNWPKDGFYGENVLHLAYPELDNHFPENWSISSLIETITEATKSPAKTFRLYPNPSNGIVYLETQNWNIYEISVYNLQGQVLDILEINPQGLNSLDLSAYGSGIYFLKLGSMVEKVVVY